MTCGKCGAELNASAKFCASCGAPTAAPAAASSAASMLADAVPPEPVHQAPANMLLLPDVAEPAQGNPSSLVNPFAVTASPNLRRPSSKPPPLAGLPIPEPKIEAKVESKPPPKSDAPPPVTPRAVSPLAVSNGISGPSPFQEALEKARQSVAPAPGSMGDPASVKKNIKKPGTVVMPNAPLRPPSKPGSEPPPSKDETPAPVKKPVPKTVAMVTAPRSPAQPAPSSVAPGAMPQSMGAPPSLGIPPQSATPGSYVAPSLQQPPPPSMPNQQQPWSQAQQARGYQPQPLAPYPPAPAPQYPAPQWGQVPAGYAHGGPVYPMPPAYAPGMRVQVTWSNGQRYPATVSQVNGQQCLVRFPDGQQHWVDAQYLTPG